MNEPLILRHPSLHDRTESEMARFTRWLEKRFGRSFDKYSDLQRWSTDSLEDFWEAVAAWSGLKLHTPYEKVLESRRMPGAKWFSGAQLNFAENLLRSAEEGKSDRVAIVSINEDGARREMSYGDLWREVAAFAAYLRTAGVGVGDRVAAVTSHSEEPIVAMLATTSVGAIWSSCSPDFGVQGIFDRFSQIEPKVLVAVDGYRYNGKTFSLVDRIEEIRKRIPSIQSVVVISQVGLAEPLLKSGAIAWEELLAQHGTDRIEFASVPFDHPVYILYSSGTTGVPKCIVHGAGGTLLQHAKELRLHTDIGANDTFFYFTTCGWMMWNWQVSGLMTGCRLLVYDGSPAHLGLERLWRLAESEKITVFGTSAKFLGSCRTAGLTPSKTFELGSIRTMTSTGSPLLPEDFDWVFENVNSNLLLASISGGTDIVSCFVLGNPTLPVYRGEIQCKGLGMAVTAYSNDGREVVGEKGELVCTEPAPSMPVRFWNDPDGSKYRKAYFERFPEVWCHGDYIEFNERGGSVIYGRSDATLNPGGVRIGTAEIYRQVETLNEIRDSLVVGQPWMGDERVILFVVLKDKFSLDAGLEKKIRDRIRDGTTPRHVPAKILAVKEVPYTVSGKKVEIAVAKILRGETVDNRDALSNPAALEQFENLTELRT